MTKDLASEFQSEFDGERMLSWAKELFSIPRSLTGPGNRSTLSYIQKLIPNLQFHDIPSNSSVFDWTVPDEWTLRDAYIEDRHGQRVLDIANHGLHILGYSEPIDVHLDLSDLQSHLFSLSDQPDAIPYVTSYYKRTWGFCLTENQRNLLKPGTYHVVIDSDLKPGRLDYADLVIPGKTSDEVMFSTYICHPMMANNELSGPVIATALAQWLNDQDNYYTYRFVFVPETIGSLVYLRKHLRHLKDVVKAGFVLTCMGDDRQVSFLPSRNGNTLADRMSRHILSSIQSDYISYSFLDRGSDERQYCSPLVDLPFVSVMRSKYGMYPEYHTSLDNFDLVTSTGLGYSLALMKAIVKGLEANHVYKPLVIGEPQLGKRGLYPTTSIKSSSKDLDLMMNILAYVDGSYDLLEIAEIVGSDIFTCSKTASLLQSHGLLSVR